MKMRRIAITGVSGYIGTRLLARLQTVQNVERIVGIDIKSPGVDCTKLKFHHQDISQPFSEVFVDNEVDAAIHLAFALKPAHDREKTRQIDIGGTSNFLEACHQARVKRIIHLSSHTVYGAHPDNTEPLTEDSPPRPLASFQYSWDKAEAERMVLDFASSHRDIPVTILRSCPVLGPNAADSVPAAMFKPIMLRVAGYDPPMQFVHEDDMIEVIIAFLGQNRAGIFNVAGDGEIRYGEISRLCGRRNITLPEWLLCFLMGISWTLHLQKESPPGGLEFIKHPLILSTEKVSREVGFRPRYTSREAVVFFISAGKNRQK